MAIVYKLDDPVAQTKGDGTEHVEQWNFNWYAIDGEWSTQVQETIGWKWDYRTEAPHFFPCGPDSDEAALFPEGKTLAQWTKSQVQALADAIFVYKEFEDLCERRKVTDAIQPSHSTFSME